MDLNLIITIIIVVLTLVILRFKNMIKFVLLGLFVGAVLARSVGEQFYELLQGISFLNNQVTLAVAKNFLLLAPAIVLSVNHYPGRGKAGLFKMILMSLVTTLFLLASVIEFLPNTLRTVVLDDSVAASQIAYSQLWITVLAAALLIIDSFYHKASLEKIKKGKRK